MASAIGVFGPREERSVPVDKERERVVRIKENIQDDLFKRKGVSGIDVDYKKRKGEATKQLSIVVHVDKKMPIDEIERDEMIPHEVDGIPTDVIECDPKGRWPSKYAEELLQKTSVSAGVTAPQSNVLQGGLSISNPSSAITNGTLGLVFDYKGQTCMVSCQHVFARAYNVTSGENLVEPSVANGGRLPNNLAGQTVAGWYGPHYDGVDLSVALTANSRVISKQTIINIGTTTGDDTSVAIGTRVAKYGAVSGYTEGTVTSVNFSYSSSGTTNFPPYNTTGCIKVEGTPFYPMFARPGDSGAIVVVQATNKVIGMVIGGTTSSPYYTVLTPVALLNKYIGSL
jgi:hypothetical protein